VLARLVASWPHQMLDRCRRPSVPDLIWSAAKAHRECGLRDRPG
jgi:hypothetical protein